LNIIAYINSLDLDEVKKKTYDSKQTDDYVNSLNFIIEYLKDFYNKNDQNLQTLGLLAALLNSDTSHSEPLYDQIVKETLQKAYLNNHQTTRNFYRQFSEMRDDNSPRIIEKHFWNIVKNYHPPEY
jgi:hypothetical protein